MPAHERPEMFYPQAKLLGCFKVATFFGNFEILCGFSTVQRPEFWVVYHLVCSCWVWVVSKCRKTRMLCCLYASVLVKRSCKLGCFKVYEDENVVLFMSKCSC